MTRGNRDLVSLAEIVEPADTHVDEETRARARTVVAAHARNAEDLRLLLDELGLGTPPQ